MLSYSEIKEKKIIVVDNTPYEVLSSRVSRKQKQKAVNQTTLRNLTTGGVEERTFHQSDSVSEADIEEKELIYIYSRNEEHWFHPAGNPRGRFSLPDAIVGDIPLVLTEGSPVSALVYNPEDEDEWHTHIVDVNIPIKVDLEVVEAPPHVKGGTADGGTKKVTLETGLIVDAPMFIEAGQRVRINTHTKEYVERTKSEVRA